MVPLTGSGVKRKQNRLELESNERVEGSPYRWLRGLCAINASTPITNPTAAVSTLTVPAATLSAQSTMNLYALSTEIKCDFGTFTTSIPIDFTDEKSRGWNSDPPLLDYEVSEGVFDLLVQCILTVQQLSTAWLTVHGSYCILRINLRGRRLLVISMLQAEVWQSLQFVPRKDKHIGFVWTPCTRLTSHSI